MLAGEQHGYDMPSVRRSLIKGRTICASLKRIIRINGLVKNVYYLDLDAIDSRFNNIEDDGKDSNLISAILSNL